MSRNALTATTVLTLISAVLLLPGLPASAQLETVDLSKGNATNGKKIYGAVCIACHGDRAQGNHLLNAPRLAGQEPWYIARQLKNFAEGIRGTNPKDIFGMQMRPMAMTLKGDQDISDIVAFIGTFTKTASTSGSATDDP